MKNKVSIGLLLCLGVMFYLGLTERIENSRFRDVENVDRVDSLYRAKKDSLDKWYKSTIDSLKLDYEVRKNLEKLAH